MQYSDGLRSLNSSNMISPLNKKNMAKNDITLSAILEEINDDSECSTHACSTEGGSSYCADPPRRETCSTPIENHHHMRPRRSCLKYSSTLAPESGLYDDHAYCKSVEFGSLTIHHHSQTLGDHPDCSSGPPIQLDWLCLESTVQHVDDYEFTRKPRRKKSSLMTAPNHRQAILIQKYGLSRQDIKKGIKESNKVKIQRTITRAFLPLNPLEDALESSTRKVKRAINKTENRKTWPIKTLKARYAVESSTCAKQQFDRCCISTIYNIKAQSI